MLTHVTRSTPERVDRDQRRQRRVDPAREPDHDPPEAVLLHVVARAEHQRRVDLGLGLEHGHDRRRPARPAARAARARARPPGGPPAAPGAPAGAAACRAAARSPRPAGRRSRTVSASANCGAAGEHARLRGRPPASARRTPARPDRRRGCRRRPRTGCRGPAGPASARARSPLPRVVRRRRGVDDQRGAGQRLVGGRAGRAPTGPRTRSGPSRASPSSSTAPPSPAWK